jgi:hypothetical protein
MVASSRTARTIEALLLVVSAFAGASGAQPRKPRIDVGEAGKLVYEIVKVHNPGASVVNSPRAFDPDFYFFAATWPNPTGSPIIGYFAVNPSTGDVWNAAGCERLTSRSVKKLQQSIRKRFHFKREEYTSLRSKRPLCGTD